MAAVVLAHPALAACPRPGGGDAAASEILNLANDLRRAQGRPAVVVSDPLTEAAQAQACFMAATGRMGHSGQGGSTIADRATGAGYRWGFLAENVAAGQTAAAQVMASWRGSAAHRQNILNPAARDIGIGIAAGNGRIYWAMVLGAAR